MSIMEQWTAARSIKTVSVTGTDVADPGQSFVYGGGVDRSSTADNGNQVITYVPYQHYSPPPADTYTPYDTPTEALRMVSVDTLLNDEDLMRKLSAILLTKLGLADEQQMKRDGGLELRAPIEPNIGRRISRL